MTHDVVIALAILGGIVAFLIALLLIALILVAVVGKDRFEDGTVPSPELSDYLLGRDALGTPFDIPVPREPSDRDPAA